jgi:site-specific DNA recombinase
MKIAIYARFSTTLQSDESTEDQARICREYARREGWEVVSTFEDKGISGGDTDRPGYQQMLAAARAGKFEIILCEDVSRLWRKESEQSRCVEELRYLKKHIIGVNDGIDTRREGFEYLLAIKGVQNAGYRKEIGKRTHRGLAGLALQGKSAGGRAYGYQSIYETVTDEKTGRKHDEPAGRKIMPERAKTVRQIFEWYADGHSARWIADELNRKGVPSPGATWKRNPDGKRSDGKWLASAIHGDPRKGVGILNNELYVGRQVWNRSRWVAVPDEIRAARGTHGKKEREERPIGEQITAEVPELRIIEQALWDRVKARQTEVHTASKTIREALHKNARTGAGPKYLFSGLLKCSECGANFVVVSAYQYGCSSNVNGGKHACANTLRVSRALVEQKLLAGIKRDLFHPAAVAEFKREVTRALTEHKRKQKPDLAAVRRKLAEVEKQIGHIIAAIKAGAFSEQLKGELDGAEAERKQLQAALNVDTREVDKVADMLPRALDNYRELVEDLGDATQREVARARTQIKHMLGGEVRLTPAEDRTHLVAEMAGDYAGLLRLAGGKAGAGLSKINVVAGVGFEPTTFGL